MSRPNKATVDYFPHFVNHGKTIFILESKYGNDGYAFWFKLLEMLGAAEQHFIDCNKPGQWEFMLAKTRLSEETAMDILETLAKLDAIEPILWENKIIRSMNFINNLAGVYKRRLVNVLNNDEIISLCKQKPHSNSDSVNINPQSKVKESKVNKSKVNIVDTTVSMSVGTDDAAPRKLVKSDFDNILDYWNKASMLKEIKAITPKRQGHIIARYKEHGLEAIYTVIGNCGKSPFMRGNSKDGWQATFDWVFLPNNFIKVLEGNYLPGNKNGDGGMSKMEQKYQETLQEMERLGL